MKTRKARRLALVMTAALAFCGMDTPVFAAEGTRMTSSAQTEEGSSTPAQLLECMTSSTVDGLTTVQPAETDDLLLNPGKGLVMRDWPSSSFPDEYYDMVSTVYMRFDWADIEPEEGVYDWDRIDSYISASAAKGKKFAFGVMNLNTSSANTYVTPKWVFDAGAEGTLFTYGSEDEENAQYWMCPDWTDPVFLEKVDDFVAALGERYNGNPNIAYIDIRSYGNWGEQHLSGLTDITYPEVTSDQLVELYMKPYEEAFPDTLLVNACNDTQFHEAYVWAMEQGMTLRLDGILGFTDGWQVAQAYGRNPTVYEFGYDVQDAKDLGYWNMDELEDDIHIGKNSYLQFPYQAYEENKEEFAFFANKIGYWLRLSEAITPQKAQADQQMQIRLSFKNDGVAYLYESSTLKIGFFDENGDLIAVKDTGISPQSWEPSTITTMDVQLDTTGIPAGRYTLAAGLFLKEDNTATRAGISDALLSAENADSTWEDGPDILLGNEGGTGDNWYVFGSTVLEDGYTAAEVWPAAEAATPAPEKNLGGTVSVKDISLSVIWEDNEDETENRPSELKVVLTQNGEAYRTAALTTDNSWKTVFRNLPEYAMYKTKQVRKLWDWSTDEGIYEEFKVSSLNVEEVRVHFGDADTHSMFYKDANERYRNTEMIQGPDVVIPVDDSISNIAICRGAEDTEFGVYAEVKSSIGDLRKDNTYEVQMDVPEGYVLREEIGEEGTILCIYLTSEDYDPGKHTWDDGVVTKEPTYTAEGERTYTCQVCGLTRTETIDRLPAPVKLESFTAGRYIIGTTSGKYLKQNRTTLTVTTNPAEATVWEMRGTATGLTIRTGNYYLCHSTGRLYLSRSTGGAVWKYSASEGFCFTQGRLAGKTYYLGYSNQFRISTGGSSTTAAYILEN